MFIEDVPEEYSRLFTVIMKRLLNLQNNKDFSYLYQVPYTDVVFYKPNDGLHFIEEPQFLARVYPTLLDFFIKNKMQMHDFDSIFPLGSTKNKTVLQMSLSANFSSEADQYLLFSDYLLFAFMRAWLQGATLFFYRIVSGERLFYLSFELNSDDFYYSSLPINLSPDTFSFTVSDTQIRGKLNEDSFFLRFSKHYRDKVLENSKLPKVDLIRKFLTYP